MLDGGPLLAAAILYDIFKIIFSEIPVTFDEIHVIAIQINLSKLSKIKHLELIILVDTHPP